MNRSPTRTPAPRRRRGPRRALLGVALVASLAACAGPGAVATSPLPSRTPAGEGTPAPTPATSAQPGVLPPAGSPVLAGVQLPAGRRVAPDPALRSDGLATPLEPVAWVSDATVADAGELWRRLAARYPETGLWPVILESLDGSSGRPWDSGELDPGGSSDPAAFDAAEVLAAAWSDSVPADPGELASLGEVLAPYGAAFPGLAPAPDGPADLDAAARVASRLPGRIGLVATARPADVPAVLGWLGPANYYADMARVSAVLRSWEDRFDAVVVGLGFDTLVVAVGRPPTGEATLGVAAEHLAFCPDNIFQGVGSVREYASLLDGQTTWAFWWD